MSWFGKAVAAVADLLAWFFLGRNPGWSWLRKKPGAAPVRATPTAVLFDGRSFRSGLAPVSPAPSGASTQKIVRPVTADVPTGVHKLGPLQRSVERGPAAAWDSPPTVVLVEPGRVSVSVLDTPTALLRVLESDTLVENPCTVCGAESTSALLDRCTEHDGFVGAENVRTPVPQSMAWVTGHTTGEFEKLLEEELARARLT